MQNTVCQHESYPWSCPTQVCPSMLTRTNCLTFLFEHKDNLPAGQDCNQTLFMSILSGLCTLQNVLYILFHGKINSEKSIDPFDSYQ